MVGLFKRTAQAPGTRRHAMRLLVDCATITATMMAAAAFLSSQATDQAIAEINRRLAEITERLDIANGHLSVFSAIEAPKPLRDADVKRDDARRDDAKYARLSRLAAHHVPLDEAAPFETTAARTSTPVKDQPEPGSRTRPSRKRRALSRTRPVPTAPTPAASYTVDFALPIADAPSASFRSQLTDSTR